jgi:ABC-type branched-subunit amino acid transport system ATPase component/branched-subunit amino acid ABC-type transport system permease component
MQKLLALVLSGAVTGAIYSMMASGLVLTYTTSGIFNFAHGAVAFTVAYLYYQLHSGLGVPIVPALIISVFVFAPLLGLLLDRLILRRLAAAPMYARIVGTIGLLVALPNLVQWLVVAVGNGVFHLGLLGNTATVQGAVAPGIGPTPAHVYHLLTSVALNSDQLAVFAVTAVSAAALWYVLRRTRVGLDMRAVVDRSGLAGLRGINAARTSAVAWVLTMLLAGLGGVLISPLFNLNSDIFTLVVLGSLAAVVLGGLRSLPMAFVGGLALGVVQNLVAGYTNVLPSWIANLTGLRSVIPYFLVLVLGLLFGRDRTRQAGTLAEERFPVDHRRGMSALRRRLPWAIATAALLAYSLQWIHVSGLRASSYDQTVIAQSLAVAVILLSFVIVTGMGGMVSLAQPTFVTAGGFAAGWALNRDWGFDVPLIATHGHLNFLWVCVIAIVVGAALGAVIALPATRLGAVYLAIWSLAAAFFFSLVPFAYQAIGHGQEGWSIPSPSVSIPGLNWLHRFVLRDGGHFDFSQLPDQIVLFLVVFGLLSGAIHALMRSPTGRAMLAVRSSQTAAEASGIRANRARIMIFALSAAIAALGGVMLSLFSLAASNSIAPPEVGLIWLALAVLFGVRRPGGALLAGFGAAASTAIFHFVASAVPGRTFNELITSAYFVPILSGLGAIQLAMEPDGILAYTGQRNLAKRRAKARRANLDQTSEVLHADELPQSVMEPARPGAVLAAQGVAAGYGDAEVLHGVDLTIEAGHIVAVLGANGAGKSTLCAVLAGALAPAKGQVRLHGEDVTALPTYQRARRGLLLVPEARGIFPGLSVQENLTVLLSKAADREKAYARFPVLSERRGQSAGLLSGGEQQMLGLAPALAEPPQVLIADEPTLGLAPLAAAAVMEAIVELRDRGSAILLVEEHASNALRVADIIVLMELGRIVWAGPRQEASVERLGSAYLGSRPGSGEAQRETADN